MRATRLKLVTGGAVALFCLGLLASGCSPDRTDGGTSLVAAGATATTAAASAGATGIAQHAGRTSVVIPGGIVAVPSRSPTVPSAALPRPAHIVIVTDENHSPAALAAGAPYLASLEKGGANLTNAYAIRHPSEPNYVALFSGSTHGLTDDSCPHTFGGGNLGAQLVKAGDTFTGYAESMPSDGYTGCSSGSTYARKHNPWVDFSTVPASSNLRYSRFPQSNFGALPTVSWVVPNLCDDMHDCGVATGDAWLKKNMSGYAKWARTHNSLLIVTFDEADSGVANRVPLVFYGAHVRAGDYARKVNHYTVLRTIEQLYRLGCLGSACDSTPLPNIWK